MCAAASVLPTSAHAQQRSPLKLSIKPTIDVMRSNAPLLLDATLTWSSPRLLEGRLELDLYVGQQRVAEYRSRDVALSASKVTLPAGVMLRMTLFAVSATLSAPSAATANALG